MVKTAVLSTTAKASARQKEKEKEKSGDMETDETPAKETTGDVGEEAAPSKRKPEPTSEALPNLSRVVPAQMPYISFSSSSRYTPVRALVASSSQPTKSSASPALILESIVESASGAGGGILVLKDNKPDEPVELVEEKAKRGLQLAATGGEEPVPAAAAAVAPAPVAEGPIAPLPQAFQYDGFED
jgi:26S proteasome regulatory subunit N2